MKALVALLFLTLSINAYSQNSALEKKEYLLSKAAGYMSEFKQQNKADSIYKNLLDEFPKDSLVLSRMAYQNFKWGKTLHDNAMLQKSLDIYQMLISQYQKPEYFLFRASLVIEMAPLFNVDKKILPQIESAVADIEKYLPLVTAEKNYWTALTERDLSKAKSIINEIKFE